MAFPAYTGAWKMYISQHLLLPDCHIYWVKMYFNIWFCAINNGIFNTIMFMFLWSKLEWTSFKMFEEKCTFSFVYFQMYFKQFYVQAFLIQVQLLLLILELVFPAWTRAWKSIWFHCFSTSIVALLSYLVTCCLVMAECVCYWLVDCYL